MTDTATKLSLVDTAKALVSLVEDAIRYGMPEPQSIEARLWASPVLMFQTFEQVEAWAGYLESESTRLFSHDGAVEHIKAAAFVDTYGIHVEAVTNRSAAPSA